MHSNFSIHAKSAMMELIKLFLRFYGEGTILDERMVF